MEPISIKDDDGDEIELGTVNTWIVASAYSVFDGCEIEVLIGRDQAARLRDWLNTYLQLTE